MDIEAKLNRALILKVEGNELFKQQKFSKALVKYGMVLAYVRGLPGSKRGLSGMAEMAGSQPVADSVTAEQEESACELEATACLNMAACHLKLQNADSALDCANKAYVLKPTGNWKALLRKGEALSLKGDCDGALQVLDQALQIGTDAVATTAISAEMKKVKSHLKQQVAAQRRAFAGIFEK